MPTYAKVNLWGRTIGAVALEDDRPFASFEYAADFVRSNIQVSPIVMPLRRRPYAFPELPRRTFHGLPGLLADCLPDKFGTAVIDAWLATEGRSPGDFNTVERLCYTGERGMGALEFEPDKGPPSRRSDNISIDALVDLASRILQNRKDFTTSLGDGDGALRDILRVGTSAGGARAKAVIAWNPETREVRSGQIDAGEGFEYWLLKFDGVSGNRDKELEDPKGYGAIELAYSEMAKAAGIEMAECRLMEENGRRHFMTRRFDRQAGGGKLHMQSLSALAHFDFNDPRAYSYEQAFLVIRQLGLGIDAVEQQFRRMAFNIMARNQDDHVKNIAFLMDKSGRWSLSPAFDVTYSFNPEGEWTSRHQMSLNGRRQSFTIDDFKAGAKVATMKRGRAESILEATHQAVNRWRDFAHDADVPGDWAEQIESTFRTDLLP